MKKLISIVLILVMALSLVACSSSKQVANDDAEEKTNSSKEETPKDDTSKEDNTVEEETGPSGTVVVYSPHEADPLNAGINMFMDAYPDIQVEVVAAGTGELLNRVAAESANPIADVFWGGGADSLAAFKEHFAPYVCANDDVIEEAYKDSEDLWIGESPLPMVLFYNIELIERDGLTIPTSWDDLTKPEWKGKIAYAMPSKSGSAYTQLITMLLGHGGKENGWAFIEKLYDNLDGKILDSSGKCHKMVADGEFHVGITIEKSAVQYAGNASLGFSYPEDGTSAVPDGIALIKNAPNDENAKIFIDYVTSKVFQEAENKDWGRRPVRNDIEVSGMAKLSDLKLVDYDFDWAAKDKEIIIERFNDIMVD